MTEAGYDNGRGSREARQQAKMEGPLPEFPLAPMTLDIRIATGVLLALPLIFSVNAWLTGVTQLAALVPVLLLLYALVWLWWRPRGFAISGGQLRIRMPLRDITQSLPLWQRAEVLSIGELRHRYGTAVRVGAGGLWGGFGWLWTRRGGWLRLYVSRTNQLVLIEWRKGPPWLISPARPNDFVAALERQAAASTGR